MLLKCFKMLSDACCMVFFLISQAVLIEVVAYRRYLAQTNPFNL